MKTSQYIKYVKGKCTIVDSQGLMKELRAFEKKKRDKKLTEKDAKQVRRVIRFIPNFTGTAGPTLSQLADRAERIGETKRLADKALADAAKSAAAFKTAAVDAAKKTETGSKKVETKTTKSGPSKSVKVSDVDKKMGDTLDKISNLDLSSVQQSQSFPVPSEKDKARSNEDDTQLALDFERRKEEEKDARDSAAIKRQFSAEEEVRKAQGLGAISEELMGLDEDQLNTIMAKLGDPDFVKTISSDELHLLPTGKSCTCIINNLPRSSGGQHWRALRINYPENTVEFFDPFGSVSEANGGLLTDKELVGLKKLTKSNPKMMKLKQNTVQNQDVTTDSCGYICAKFLSDRAKGISFKDATNYIEPTQDFSDKTEAEIIDMRKKFKTFI
jgi:hypothetical protein